MAKRPSHKAIRAARSYTIEEAAGTLGVTIGTVRNWVKAGLPTMRSQRPYLILGEALKDFLQKRTKRSKAKLAASELYCLTCKEPREPLGLLVDCTPQNPSTARLTGLCEVCGGTCNRMISRSKIEEFSRIFELQIRGTQTA
jgi:excisionase family DNA binding protein